MTRRARTHTSIFGLALLFLVIPLWWSASHVTGSSSTSTTASTGSGGGSGGSGGSGFVVPPDFQATLIRTGLEPKALAASGILALEVGPILQAAADYLNAHPNALSEADSARAAARVLTDQLLRTIQSGLGSQEDVTAYQAALASFNTATSQRQAVLDACFAAGTANVSVARRTTLDRIRSNRAQDWSRDFPTEFLVIAREEAEWVALRDALANEKIAMKYPDLLSVSAQVNLATWRADPAVAAAKIALTANLDSVTEAWNTAAGAH